MHFFFFSRRKQQRETKNSKIVICIRMQFVERAFSLISLCAAQCSPSCRMIDIVSANTKFPYTGVVATGGATFGASCIRNRSAPPSFSVAFTFTFSFVKPRFLRGCIRGALSTTHEFRVHGWNFCFVDAHGSHLSLSTTLGGKSGTYQPLVGVSVATFSTLVWGDRRCCWGTTRS